MKSTLSELRENAAKALALAQAAIAEEVLPEKFDINTRNDKKLRRSLTASGMRDIAQRTLLTPKIHKEHAAVLAERLLRHAKRFQQKGAINADKAQDRFRFLTLLDSLQLVDKDKILTACEKMRRDIHAAVAETSGIWILGVIEVEIVNMHIMRKVRESGKAAFSEMRKLETLEAMCNEVQLKNASSLALVHFHGVVTSIDNINFDALRTKLNKVHRWRRVGRQVEIKKLSEHFAGKKKTLENNLRSISLYITKGGNDWVAGKSYLRYKIGFNNDDYIDEGTWILKNYRRNQDLLKLIVEEGVEDVLSMTGFEIATQAQVIDELMSLKRNRTGYLVHAKSGNHSRNLSN